MVTRRVVNWEWISVCINGINGTFMVISGSLSQALYCELLILLLDSPRETLNLSVYLSVSWLDCYCDIH